MDENTMTREVAGKCPFCDGTFEAGFTGAKLVPTIVHTIPPCKKFRDLEPDVFLTAVRKRLQS